MLAISGAMILMVANCGNRSSDFTDDNIEDLLSCNVERTAIPVTVSSDETEEEVSSEGIVSVASTDSVSFIIPEGTTSILREVYNNPDDSDEAVIDNDITAFSSDRYPAGETFTADVSQESPGAVVRYFVCSDNAINCYPSCYQAQILLQLTE